jgi:hypothetical protein
VRLLGSTATLSRGIINNVPVHIRDGSGSLPLLLLRWLRWLLSALGYPTAWRRGSSEDGSSRIAVIVSCSKHAKGDRGEAGLGPSQGTGEGCDKGLHYIWYFLIIVIVILND